MSRDAPTKPPPPPAGSVVQTRPDAPRALPRAIRRPSQATQPGLAPPPPTPVHEPPRPPSNPPPPDLAESDEEAHSEHLRALRLADEQDQEERRDRVTAQLPSPPRPGGYRKRREPEPESFPPSSEAGSSQERRLLALFEARNRELEAEILKAKSKGSNALIEIAKALGVLATGILALVALLRPAARPEQVDAIEAKTKAARRTEVIKDSVDSSYETQVRAVYECRFAQLAFIADRNGYELGWDTRDVAFMANQIVSKRNAQGFMVEVEKPPFRPRKDDKCPAMPKKPAQ